uniref:Tafazzin family protein n=1 Tax=Rhizophora mucronata TaxID=61149 RepID=A0A2P2JSH8_RHIMU
MFYLFSNKQLHFFPQGKVSQEDVPIRRLKWGAASLIDRSSITPIVLPIVHHGFEKVMPEKYWFGRKPPFPLCNRRLSITVGEPIQFNLPKMREIAVSMSGNISVPSRGWPKSSCGLDEKAQIYLYMTISEQIRTAMESLRVFGKNILKKTSRIQPS